MGAWDLIMVVAGAVAVAAVGAPAAVVLGVAAAIRRWRRGVRGLPAA